jgi:hypothetical protein
MLANPARGEVPLEINGAKIILCAEIGRLATYSDKLGNPPLRGIFERLNGSEIAALFHFIDCFAIDGDAVAFKAAIKTFDDIAVVQAAAFKVFEAFVGKPDPKKADGGTQ